MRLPRLPHNLLPLTVHDVYRKNDSLEATPPLLPVPIAAIMERQVQVADCAEIMNIIALIILLLDDLMLWQSSNAGKNTRPMLHLHTLPTTAGPEPHRSSRHSSDDDGM